MLISTTYINATERYIISEDDCFEAQGDTIAELHKQLSAKLGESSPLLDDEGSQIGWTFSCQAAYEDEPQKHYTQLVDVVVHDKEPEWKVTRFIHKFSEEEENACRDSCLLQSRT